MLEKIPAGVGKALRKVRAGRDKLASECGEFEAAPQSIALESAAFEDGEPMPARYTADGDKVSPPLAWQGIPEGARSLVLIVEDPDAPTPDPLMHLLAFDLPPDQGELAEGLFKSPRHDGLDEDLGRNSYLQAAYLPPDPPAGHGPHLYAFQLFALNRRLDFDRPPGRAAVIEAMRGHVLAKGVLTATYERS
jgi:Raf kinase inhibitor-like YbhB/YbcL family protein